MSAPHKPVPLHFIAQRIERDLRHCPGMQIRLRFPPEPNGYLHLGHAKALLLNFELAKKYGGSCHLRFDDTNPSQESQHYVDSILYDLKWLGYGGARVTYTSDYFEMLHEYAVQMILKGKAYIDSHDSDVFAQKYKGTPTQIGSESPDRRRKIAENLELFDQMKQGKYPAGSFTLRAKIDMHSPNMHLRDPSIYRIKERAHFRKGNQWCIYPTYDFAHCISDAIEGITHSLCSLEFEVHRPLYEWILDTLLLSGPKQIEFARLNLSHTVLSKRKMAMLIKKESVGGWNDPRLATLSGMRRRGYKPSAIRCFVERVGLSKRKSLTDESVLAWALRRTLNVDCARRMAILWPLKVVITNYPSHEEWVSVPNNPENPQDGARKMPFSRDIYIEQADFSENPPSNFFRLSIGEEVRLKYAYIIRCDEVVKDEKQRIAYLKCSYDPNTKSGTPGANRKVKSTLGWVSCAQAYAAEIRHYKPLFSIEEPESASDYLHHLQPNTMEVIRNAQLEPILRDAKACETYQFERLGYYSKDEKQEHVFHQGVPLRDAFKKPS